jgi:hypothetical protein
MLNRQAAQLHFACPRGPLHARVRTGRHHARIGGHREKTLVAFVRSVNCVVHETVGASHAMDGFDLPRGRSRPARHRGLRSHRSAYHAMRRSRELCWGTGCYLVTVVSCAYICRLWCWSLRTVSGDAKMQQILRLVMSHRVWEKLSCVIFGGKGCMQYFFSCMQSCQSV